MISKRTFDVVLVTLGALIWVPVLTTASLAVLVFSGRPIYYRSMRRVSSGKVMKLVKFRAMVRNADKLANRETVPVANTRFLNIPPDSPLYTSVGRTIERLGLTELPQLVHVLRGEMSLVGNRPLPENVMDCLRIEYPYADDRFLSPAGLTGPAQLVGRDSLTDAERLTLEGAYCRTAAHSYTFWLDFKIILYTVLIVLHLKESLTYQEVLDLVQGGPVVPVQMPHPHVTQLATADSDVAEAAVS